MPWVVLGLVAMAILAVLFQSLAKDEGNSGSRAGHQEFAAAGRFTKVAVLTDPERTFFVRLRQAVGSELEVFPKVRLLDIVEPRGSGGDRLGAKNRVAQKHVDFLLVGRSDFTPVAAIEVDDRSHNRPDRQDRDRLVEDILASVRLPLLRFRVQSDWDPAQIRATVAESLKQVDATNAR